MALKPWYKVVTPREDLRLGKPRDASVVCGLPGQGPGRKRRRRLSKPGEVLRGDIPHNKSASMASMAAEVVRRLSGEKTEASAVFNLKTQLGGGKPTPSPSSTTSSKTVPKPRAGTGRRAGYMVRGVIGERR